MHKKIISDNPDRNILSIRCEIPLKFDSSQLKRDLILGITNFVYKFPHELLSDVRLSILGN